MKRIADSLGTLKKLFEPPKVDTVLGGQETLLTRMSNRLLSRGPEWPMTPQLQDLKTDYPIPQVVARFLMTREESFTWYERVAMAAGKETAWSLFGFVKGSHVTAAQSIVPDDIDRTSMTFNTEVRANPKIAALNAWYFNAWSHMRSLELVPADVYLDFIGCGHNHPPNVFHRLSTPHDTRNPQENDLATIARALSGGMPLYVAPLCRMDAQGSQPYVLPSFNKTAAVHIPAPAMRLKVFTATRLSPHPVETDIQFIDELPYALPPLSWHVVYFYQLQAVQAKLKTTGTDITWSIKSDPALPLPYVQFQVENAMWRNSVVIQTAHDFPQSQPQMYLVSRYVLATTPPAPIPLSGIWDGSKDIERILQNLYEKGLLTNDAADAV